MVSDSKPYCSVFRAYRRLASRPDGRLHAQPARPRGHLHAGAGLRPVHPLPAEVPADLVRSAPAASGRARRQGGGSGRRGGGGPTCGHLQSGLRAGHHLELTAAPPLLGRRLESLWVAAGRPDACTNWAAVR